MAETNILGPARDRVDGRLKVTGAAKYAVEFEVPKCAYAWPVESNIANGKIAAIDFSAAKAVPGVLAVLTHENSPKPSSPTKPIIPEQLQGMRSEKRLPLSDDTVYYAGQYVALVVAETIPAAQYAASLVRVTYTPTEPILNLEGAQKDAKQPSKNNNEKVQPKKGDVGKAFSDSSLTKIEQTYITPTETHNPIEMSGTIAHWEAEDKLTLYDATQFVKGGQSQLAHAWNLPVENVRVICPYVGGAFGCKGAIWPHVLLAATAAKATGVPVKFYLPRKSMFTSAGHRTPTRQTLTLAASSDGKLKGMQHVSQTLTSPVGQFTESCGARSTALMYASDAINIEETVFPVNVATPTFMRAPGECPGTYALECAMDELALALKMDPVQLRVVNHAENDPIKDVPFSAKFLKQCYEMGAERFGWSKRNPQPGSMKDGNLLVGWGMATKTYPAHKMVAAGKIIYKTDGTATVQCATHDLGTGAYTAFTEISAEQFGIPFEKITFDLGSSDYPFGPVAGGSNSTATVGTALHELAGMFHQSLAELAVKDAKSPLYHQKVEEVAMVAPGRIGLRSDSGKSDGYNEILQRAGRDSFTVESKVSAPEQNKKFTFQSWGADFVEVKIDPLLPRVQVTRVTSVVNGGRIVNAKTARSQILGGVIMGIGMALTEATEYDPMTGLPVIRNLADYHVLTNADAPVIDVGFVGEPDFEFNPIGCRGLGEIGITGIAAAVANAVYHATGKRVRDLPITPDKLI